MAAGKPHCGRPAREGTVSQRRPIVPRVVEGTEILVSAVALFGKVSADRAVGFICREVKMGSLQPQKTAENSRGNGAAPPPPVSASLCGEGMLQMEPWC